MSCVEFSRIVHITMIVCLLLSIIRVSQSENSDIDENIHSMKVRKKPHKRKSPRLAFLQETDDPMFKFLTKILNTAQQRSKGALTRAQNGLKMREELKNELTNTLEKNHIPVKYY